MRFVVCADTAKFLVRRQEQDLEDTRAGIVGIADVALTRDNYLSKLEAIQQLGVGHRLLEARVSLMEKHFRGSCRKDRPKRRKPPSGAPTTPPTWHSTIYGWMLGLAGRDKECLGQGQIFQL